MEPERVRSFGEGLRIAAGDDSFDCYADSLGGQDSKTSIRHNAIDVDAWVQRAREKKMCADAPWGDITASQQAGSPGFEPQRVQSFGEGPANCGEGWQF